MFELFETPSKVDVQQAEFNRLLGYPKGHLLEGRSQQLATEARQWYATHGRPWLYARHVEGVELRDGRVRVAGVEFASPQLHEQLTVAEARSVVVAAVSAGPECEAQAQQHWREEKPDEYFFTETYGSAVVENLVTVAAGRLCAWADQNQMAALPHYSPGYSGWDMTDQGKMWEVLNRGRTRPLPGELEVMTTGMLVPKKSLLALFGLTTQLERAKQLQIFIPCENCALDPCRFRRAPYRNGLPLMEEVRPSQRSNNEACQSLRERPQVEPELKYSLNLGALRKWSKERLRLERLSDGSTKASFRYDGTTCSNMGRPLAFDYQVRLAPVAEQYRILELSCVPSAGDVGYQSMCEYLRDGPALMGKIESEKPLLGHPLQEALHWQRVSSPSGCYCEQEMRMHKWGLVFEVTHFALARFENEAKAVQDAKGVVHTSPGQRAG
jgi:hypothetical protein